MQHLYSKHVIKKLPNSPWYSRSASPEVQLFSWPSVFQNIQKQASGILLAWQRMNVKWDFAGGRNVRFALSSALSDPFNVTSRRREKTNTGPNAASGFSLQWSDTSSNVENADAGASHRCQIEVLCCRGRSWMEYSSTTPKIPREPSGVQERDTGCLPWKRNVRTVLAFFQVGFRCKV